MTKMEVKYRLKKLGIEEKIQVVTDYNAGMSVNDILKKHGISRMTMYRILKQQLSEEVKHAN